MSQFLKDKFEVIVVSIVFIVVFSIWVTSDYRADVKEILIAIFGAWLALLRVVQKPGVVNADQISADNIETAKTERGNIITTPKSPGGK